MRRVLLAVLFPSFAFAQYWEVNGSPGTFGSAEAACKEALRDNATLEFAPPSRKGESEDPDRIFRECWARTKGESSADGGNVPIKHTLAWFTPAKNDDDDDDKKDGQNAESKKKEGCGADTDFSWFPSLEKSSLKSAGSMVQADADPGSCMVKSRAAGERLFTGSKKNVRADRMKKESKPAGEHYYLKHQKLIIDPTFFQFFRVRNEAGDRFEGLVFVGTEAQLIQTADKLYALCGANPKTNDSKNGTELKAANFDGAKLCNAGAKLTIDGSGSGAYATTEGCDP